MKWRKKEKVYKTPNDLETRTIERFLFFPKCINDEYRWLEKVKIKQIYHELEIHQYRDIFGGIAFTSTGGYWSDVEFVD